MPKVSNTAYIIANSLHKFSKSKRWSGYFSNEAKELYELFSYNFCDTKIRKVLATLPLKITKLAMDNFFIPGMTHHYLFRKLYIEKFIRSEIKDGTKQIVILGAGLDTLALRLAGECNVNFIEIDTIETCAAKMNLLHTKQYQIPENYKILPINLATTKIDELLNINNNFYKDKKTIFIAEGLLMYLTESEVVELFSDLHKSTESDTSIIFGAITKPHNSENWKVRITSSLLKKGNEDVKWHCKKENMPKFLADHGYKLLNSISYKDLQRKFLNDNEIRNVPEEDENYYTAIKQ